MNSNDTFLPDIRWDLVYANLGRPLDFGNLLEDPPEGSWYIYVLPGITERLLYRAFDSYRIHSWGTHISGIDTFDGSTAYSVDDRPHGSTRYRIEVRKQFDPEYLGVSPKTLEDQWIGSVTLVEMMLLHYAFFLETGRFLDSINRTICSGTHIYRKRYDQRFGETGIDTISLGTEVEANGPKLFGVRHLLDVPPQMMLNNYGIRSVRNFVPCRVT